MAACVWTGITSGGAVLPDGCVDVVCAGGELVIAGPGTVPARPGLEAGLLKLGVRFRVGAAGAALGFAMHELVDQAVPLSELWGRDAVVAADRIAMARTPSAALSVLIRAVGERLASAGPIDLKVRTAVMASARWHTLVGALARSLGITERHLLRRFRHAVGYGPTTLARVLRFQRFLAAAQRRNEARADLAGLAIDAGYCDQAHLTRECRRLAGLTPTDVLAWRITPAGERSDSFKTVPQAPGRLSA
jgi:AraC-like DNA-binding protein